jgi:hypothetical protein
MEQYDKEKNRTTGKPNSTGCTKSDNKSFREQFARLKLVFEGSGNKHVNWAARALEYEEALSEIPIPDLILVVSRAVRECEWFPAPAKLLGFWGDIKAANRTSDEDPAVRQRRLERDLSELCAEIDAVFQKQSSEEQASIRHEAGHRLPKNVNQLFSAKFFNDVVIPEVTLGMVRRITCERHNRVLLSRLKECSK